MPGVQADGRKEVLVRASAKKHPVFVGEFDAWLFDLDGVITDTASVHAAAWKATFDGYLKEVSERDGCPFVPFEVDPDYYRHVDGKPRYDGVDTFLRSRGIVLRWGTPDDAPSTETVCGLGNRKNTAFNEVLRARGAEVFESSVALIRELRSRGTRVAVVTNGPSWSRTLSQGSGQDEREASASWLGLRGARILRSYWKAVLTSLSTTSRTST